MIAAAPYYRRDDAAPSGVALLTVSEACAYLRISRWSLYQLINRGQLKTITIGRRRLIPTEALSNFVERLTREARP